MTVVHVDPVTDSRWADLVAAYRASLFHSPPWIAAVASTYGFDLRAALVVDPGAAGVARAGVAYALLEDDLGRRAVTLPFTDACDPLFDSQDHWTELARAVTAFGAPWSLRVLDGGPIAADDRFPVTGRARWHRLDVRGTDDERWAAAAGAFRRGVTKARNDGIEIRPLREPGAVEAIAALHGGLRRAKYAMLSQPDAFFAALRAQFAPLDGWHPLGAFHHDQLIAMTVYLRWGDTLYYKFNASDPDALASRPNNLLLWEGAALARRLGCRALDLGPSGDDQPGLIRFKAQSGAVARELTVRTWTPPGSLPSPRAVRLRATLDDLTALLVAPGVDDQVTRAAGNVLYRWFA